LWPSTWINLGDWAAKPLQKIRIFKLTKRSLGLIVLLSVIFIMGCNFANIPAYILAPSQTPPAKVVVATDGNSQLTVSGGWEVVDNLNKAADLQAKNQNEEIYAIVITENKEDFINFSKYADLCYSKFLKIMESPDVVGPTQLTINGKSAIQYKVSGTVKAINVVYLYTLIEGNEYFDQLIVWTLHSKFDTNETKMQNVIQSFQEISK
jgi:hypothetical protein